MKIQKFKIADLKPAEYNPRIDLKPGDAEYEKIKRSIKEFGFIEPIIINSDCTIIGGHQRYKVLKDLGFQEIECSIVELDKMKEKALNIALNKISGIWDNYKLDELLKELNEQNFDVGLTGFEFDQDICDIPDELDLERISDDGEKENIDYLKFADKKVPLTSRELNELNAKYEYYTKNCKTNYGFVKYLLGEYEQ